MGCVLWVRVKSWYLTPIWPGDQVLSLWCYKNTGCCQHLDAQEPSERENWTLITANGICLSQTIVVWLPALVCIVSIWSIYCRSWRELAIGPGWCQCCSVPCREPARGRAWGGQVSAAAEVSINTSKYCNFYINQHFISENLAYKLFLTGFYNFTTVFSAFLLLIMPIMPV